MKKQSDTPLVEYECGKGHRSNKTVNGFCSVCWIKFGKAVPVKKIIKLSNEGY